MTQLVRQRLKFDCGICTLAMATGRPYAEIRAAAEEGSNFDVRQGIRREWQVLGRLGLQMGGHVSADGDFWSLERSILAPEAFRRHALGRRAIMAVPSLNMPGHLHSIYWDGTTVFDPHPKRLYTRFDELLPDELILFREAA